MLCSWTSYRHKAIGENFYLFDYILRLTLEAAKYWEWGSWAPKTTAKVPKCQVGYRPLSWTLKRPEKLLTKEACRRVRWNMVCVKRWFVAVTTFGHQLQTGYKVNKRRIVRNWLCAGASKPDSMSLSYFELQRIGLCRWQTDKQNTRWQ